MNENLWQCIIKTSQNMKVISWRVLQSRLINVGLIVQVISSHWRILRKDDMLKNTYFKCTASWSQLERQKLVKRGKIIQEIVASTGITTWSEEVAMNLYGREPEVAINLIDSKTDGAWWFISYSGQKRWKLWDDFQIFILYSWAALYSLTL